MLETFLLLLSGGIMLAVAIPEPRDVTINWLRLGGILALTFSGLAIFWYFRSHAQASRFVTQTSTIAILLIGVQLATSQLAQRTPQRIAAIFAFTFAILAAGAMLERSPLLLIGTSAMCGVALMDMLIGHAYLTASKMPMRPFALNISLVVVLIASVVANVFAGVREPWWGRDGLLVGTRWFVGLLVPAVFVYMAHDCIKRRATQSATGILYVAGVLIFIGQIIALQLVRDTGLPF